MMAASNLVGGLVLVAVTSTVVSLLLVQTQAWHGGYSLDSDLRSKQKMHNVPVPRIGGVAVFAALAAAAALGSAVGDMGIGFTRAAAWLLLAACPVFLAGMLEDLTKAVSARARLLAAALSALLAAWLLGSWLPSVGVVGVDDLMQLTPLALAVTVLAVSGVTNAINIIDGFNGLAGFVVVIMMAALAWLNWQVGDILVMQLALAGVAATCGFLVLNYPSGRIFLGDGGAYLLGFWLAQLAVLTVARNPSVSPWQVLSICAYPVIEVLFSIYRKRMVRGASSMVPDRLHFHILLYRRVMCQFIPVNPLQPWRRNSGVAIILATWVAIGAILTLAVGSDRAGALAIIAANVLVYLGAYARLVRGHWCWRPTVVLGLRSERRVSLPRPVNSGRVE